MQGKKCSLPLATPTLLTLGFQKNLIYPCIRVWKTCIDGQLIVAWGTDSSNAEVLDFTMIPNTIIVSYCDLN